MVLSLPSAEPRLEAAPDSDHLDSEEEAPVGKKRKASKASLEKKKAAAKKKAKKQDDDDYEDEDDAYTALSRSMWSNNSKPSIGSLKICAKCAKRFTMVRISLAIVCLPSCLYSTEDEIYDCRRLSPGLSLSLLRQILGS